MTVDRYDACPDGYLDKHPEGDWVAYDDYAALEARLKLADEMAGHLDELLDNFGITGGSQRACEQALAAYKASEGGE
jgi:hypothetical protein